MKLIITTIAVLFFSTAAFTQPIDRIGVKGPLEFDSTNFHLVWSDKADFNYFIQEYLPEGENVESFNQMLAIHFLETDIGLEKAVGLKINELKEREKTDPLVKYKIFKNADKTEYIIDFIVGEHEGEYTNIIELNFHRYKEINLSKKRKALILFAYSKRAYKNDTYTFMQNLASYREKYLKEITSTTLPEVTISKK